jgi:hypothetical protein
VLSLVAMTGCPDDFGKEGTIDRAAHQDTLDRLESNCPERIYQLYCSEGREQSAECLKRCGG